MTTRLKRRGRRLVRAVVLLVCGVAGPAFADALPGQAPASDDPADHPFVVPQHDVDVLYAVPVPASVMPPSGSGPEQIAGFVRQRMRFSVALQRQRVDPPGPGTYMITDYASRHLIMVQPQQRLATTVPAPGGPIAAPGARATGQYRRLGAQTVAGLACTDWSTRDDSGNESVVCLTPDGVLLRANQGGHLLVQAVSAAFLPQDQAVFEVPDGYRLQQPPNAAR
ncbi:hypothetical protein [Lichenicola sp.]|uniref:hypothetical protein n=1 Tax=Lichenicola sp. TaxID=2804529 RepID=UPI003AFFA46C